MLLLNFNEDEREFSTIEYRNVRLASLMIDLRMGEVTRAKARPVCRSAFSNLSDESPVVMLKMNHFIADNERINWDLIREDLVLQDLTEETELIDRTALLEADDLLINLRGQTRVFRITAAMMDDMPEDMIQRGLRLAATNNFVLMRPNPQLVHISFLQIIMDILLEDLSREWLNILSEKPSDALMHQYLRWKYTGRGSSPKPTGLPIGVRELKDISIDIPADQWTQRVLAHRYSVLQYNERMVREKSLEFRSTLNKYINPNITP